MTWIVAGLSALAALAFVGSMILRIFRIGDRGDTLLGLAAVLFVPALALRVYSHVNAPTVAEVEAEAAARKASVEIAERQAKQEKTPEGIAKTVYWKRGEIVPTVVELGSGRILVTATTSSFLTAYFLRQEVLENAAAYLKAAFAANPHIAHVEIDHRATMVDVRGQESIDPVVRIVMSRRVADSINWTNFDRNNFAIVADHYWEHPAFSR